MEKWLLLFILALLLQIGVYLIQVRSQRKRPPFDSYDDEAQLVWEASPTPLIGVLWINLILVAFLLLAWLLNAQANTFRDLILTFIVGNIGYLLGLNQKIRFQLDDIGLAKLMFSNKGSEKKQLFTWDQVEKIERKNRGFSYTLLKESLSAAQKVPTKAFIPTDGHFEKVMAYLAEKGVTIDK